MALFLLLSTEYLSFIEDYTWDDFLANTMEEEGKP